MLQWCGGKNALEEAGESTAKAHPSWLVGIASKFRIDGEQEWGLIAGEQVKSMFSLPD